MAVNSRASIDPTCPMRFDLRRIGIDDGDDTIIRGLLAGTRASNKTAINTLVSTILPWLRNVSRKHLGRLVCRDFMDEDDVAIDVLLVFIKKFAINRFPGVNDASSLRRLLTRMAHNYANSVARRSRHRFRHLKKEADLPFQVDINEFASGSGSDQIEIAMEALDELTHFRRRLTVQEDQVIELLAQGAQAHQIASLLAFSNATVYRRIQTIRAKWEAFESRNH